MMLNEIKQARTFLKTSFLVEFTDLTFSKSFESLIEKRLVSFMDEKPSSISFFYRPVRLALEPQVILNFIKHGDCLQWIEDWIKLYVASK